MGREERREKEMGYIRGGEKREMKRGGEGREILNW